MTESQPYYVRFFCPMCEWTLKTGSEWEDEAAAETQRHIDGHDKSDVLKALLAAIELIRELQKAAVPVQLPPKTCKKIGYPDERTASQWMLRSWRKADPRRKERRAYQCDRCAYWHLTSQPSKVAAT